MAEPRLVYLSNNRLPTEKAHGLQIVQMCEALADAGYAVTLVAPRRFNTREMRAVRSLWDHYGVRRAFAFTRLPCLDLFPLFPRHAVAFLVQTFTYLLAILAWLPFQRADLLYTRDLFIGAALTLLRPRTPLVYEVHQVHHSRLGRRLQGRLARRAHVVTITGYLAGHMRELGAARVLVAHDGFRAARFDGLPSKAEARAARGWPADAFIVGWAGRLTMLGLDKGVGALVEALHEVEGAHLAIVGGPEEMVTALRARWTATGLDGARLLAAGQVPPDAVPLYLSAFDVCAMPHPWTEQFAYYTSPIKLFEYMAAGRAIIASNLPAFAEVLAEEETALLVPPGDTAALAAAIRRLRDDPVLRQRLGRQARTEALARHTWAARAAAIKVFVEGAG
ncbi:MAG: glycosyltransferase [Anaerolineae bacterium]|nr:glycosyltransferase [Anaerolineae bacterium]